jgi:hypothetical protein
MVKETLAEILYRIRKLQRVTDCNRNFVVNIDLG